MGTQLTYGSLGPLSPARWRELLHSEEGLFQPVGGPQPRLAGPHLSSTGLVSGDSLGEEGYYFVEFATSEQADFLNSLSETNLPAAEEYVLRMTILLPRWRRDFSRLELAALYLQQERDLLEQERRTGTPVVIPAPDELREYCPAIFHDINLQGLTRNQARQQIGKLLRTEIVPEERYLRKYLKEKKREMPFLFV